MRKTPQVSNLTDNSTIPVVTRADARRQASDLDHSTNSDMADIATEVGVWREKAYSWIFSDEMPLGRNANHPPAAPTGQDAVPTTVDMAEFRGPLAVLTAQIGRFERLVEALVAPKDPDAA